MGNRPGRVWLAGAPLFRRTAGAVLLAWACMAASPSAVARPDAAPAPRPAARRDGPLVQAGLLADVEAVQPGRAFTVGVLLKIAPAWHVYWKNPGDAGLATSVELHLPTGFRAGPLRWPVPRVFRQSGDIVGYGYDRAVLLSAEVTPPKDLPLGANVEIGADVGYLACRDACVPGQAKLRRTLPTARAARAAPAARAKLFEQWRGKLPVPADRADEIASTSVTGQIAPGETGGRFAVTVQWKSPPGPVQWLPAATVAILVENVSVTTNNLTTRIVFTATALTKAGAAADTLETLLVRQLGKAARRGIVVAVPLRPSKRPARKIEKSTRKGA